MKRLLLLAGACLSTPAYANYCAAPLVRADATVSGIVNSYYPVTSNYASGPTIELGPARSCAGCPQHDIRSGDLLLLIQPQGALANTGVATSAYGANNGTGRGWTNLNLAGRYQWVRVTGGATGDRAQGQIVKSATTSGTIRIFGGVDPGAAIPLENAGSTIRAAQAVLVPQYANVIIVGTITAPPWRESASTGASGPLSTGGIVALDVAGTLTFSGGRVDVDGLGFRGGAGHMLGGAPSGTLNTLNNLNGYGYADGRYGGIKGEGVAGTPKRIHDAGMLRDGFDWSASGAPPEGYGSTFVPTSYGRGAPGNAGGGATDQCPLSGTGSSTNNTMCQLATYAGNRLNTGGGGGAGAGDGGMGGNQDADGTLNTYRPNGGGLGGKGIYPASVFISSGIAIPAAEHQYASMGGGGGAGSTNDSASPLSSSGGTGGGIVLIRAGRIAGNGSISADGGDAPDVATADGAGGGGGGGWILVGAHETSSPSLLLSARGGRGGSASGGMGSGGGGGGSFIGTSDTLPPASPADVAGGSAGVTSGMLANSGAITAVQPSAAVAGSSGSVTSSFAMTSMSVPSPAGTSTSSAGIAPGSECIPVVTKQFSADGGATYRSNVTTASETPFRMRLRLHNPNRNSHGSAVTSPQLFEDITLAHSYPSGLANAAIPNVQVSGCGTLAVTAEPNAATLTIADSGMIEGGSTCEIAVDLVANAPGTHVSQLAAGAVGVIMSKQATPQAATTLSTIADSTATVSVPAGLTVARISTAVYDPLNAANDPKRIPSAAIDLLLTVGNPASHPLTSGTMDVRDALSSGTKLYVGDLTSGAPLAWNAATSGLTCTFLSLADSSDCIDFSSLENPSPDSADWSYAPTPDADGADPLVRHVRFRPAGAMAANSEFSIRYRVLVK